MKNGLVTKSFSIPITLILCALLMVTPVAAAGEGPVTSSFTTTVSPVTNGIIVLEAGTDIAVSGVTPQHSYDIKISITDNDGLGDLTTVRVKLWYDSTGSLASRTAFDAQTSPSNTGYQEIVWDRATNTVSTSNLANTSWTYPSHIVPSNTYLANVQNTSFDFVFTVKVGKAATETKNAARWHVAVLTTDTANYDFYRAYTDNGKPGIFMNWYGEVSTDPVTIDWGAVPLGLDFDDDLAEKSLGESAKVKYISNGVYTTGIKATKTWSTTLGSTLALAENTVKEDTFALKAWYTALENPNTSGTLLREDGNNADMALDQAATDEAGTDFGNNRLYLALANKITNPGEYIGTIYYTIHN